MLLAVEHLHGRDVLHRDIKAENILVDEAGHVRLADMNVAKQLASGSADDASRTCAAPPLCLASQFCLVRLPEAKLIACTCTHPPPRSRSD